MLRLYRLKRGYLFFDEWGFYLMLLLLHMLKVSPYLQLIIAIYGIGAINTSYRNLALIEDKLGIPRGWQYWPIR